MYDPDVLRFALLSGLIGFSAFCISYAFYVWRKRNSSLSGVPSTRNDALRQWAFCLGLAGGFAIAIAVAVREIHRIEGVLAGDGLYAVRSPDDEYQLTYLIDVPSVAEGDVVARLESPKAAAEARELELECRRLEKERDALLLDSLTLDPELVRRHQNAITRANQLQASIDQLLPDAESVLRQVTLERLTRQEKRSQLEIDIAWYEGELKRATRQQIYVDRELARMSQLIERDAITESEVDLRRKQADELDMEIANLKLRIEGMKKHRARIDSSLHEIETLRTEQTEKLGGELNRARSDRAIADNETQDSSARLQEDTQRARKFRERQIEQLEIELEQCQTQLAGIKQTFVVRAPYAGSIVYRDPSPRSAEEKQPLLVLSRQSGFRLQARLPRRQAAALENTDELTMKLVDPFVESYFGGRYLDNRTMPQKPNYVVAEFSCQPPREAIQEWMTGEKIVARIEWRPPLTTLLPFQLGAVLLLLGTTGWALTWTRRTPPRRLKQANGSNGQDQFPGSPKSLRADARGEQKRSSRLAVYETANLESGSVSALHELLGERLRETILRDEVDSDLLSAVEWALDRHHTRAVRQIRVGLGCDNELEARVDQLRQQIGTARRMNGNDSHTARERERVLRVLRTVVPGLPEINTTPP